MPNVKIVVKCHRVFLKDKYITNSEMVVSRSLKGQASSVTASLIDRLFILYNVEWFDDESHEPYGMNVNAFSIVELYKK